MLDKNKLIAFLFTMLSMSMASEENSLLAELQGIEKKFISECNADKFEIPAIAQALNKCNIEVKNVFEYSGENKPAFRNGGNRQTGIQETALAA